MKIFEYLNRILLLFKDRKLIVHQTMKIIYILYSTFSSPPKRPSLRQTWRGTRQRWFLFYKFTLKKFEKNWVNQIFKIWYEYNKNNSYINFNDWEIKSKNETAMK